MLRNEYVFNPPCEIPNFWGMSEVDLARACHTITELRPTPEIQPLQAEAARLFDIWCDAIHSPNRPGHERQHRNFMIMGLRKRTIQILIRMAMQGLITTPTAPAR